jgi:hypothetical protein
VVVVVAGVFVEVVLLVVESLLQPVNTATHTRPNSAIRVYVRFIVGVTFTKIKKRQAQFWRANPGKLPGFYWGQ